MTSRFGKGKLILGGMTALGIGFSSFTLLPNTVFLETLEEVVQMYRYGTAVEIPPKTIKIVECVMNDMKVDPAERERIKPFTVYGLDTFHAGYSGLGNGAIIGIPSNFYYSSVGDVECENITVRNKSIDWASDAAKQLKNSLVMSEDAQKYLIAREIAIVQFPEIYFKSVYPLGFALFAYGFTSHVNRKFNFLNKPLMIRSVFYVLVGLFSGGLWAFFQDITTYNVEMAADKLVCSLGEDYVRGGIEAYSQIQQRNISLRELLGSTGPSIFSSLGNNIYLFRQKHVPLTVRKEFVETYAICSKQKETKV